MTKMTKMTKIVKLAFETTAVVPFKLELEIDSNAKVSDLKKEIKKTKSYLKDKNLVILPKGLAPKNKKDIVENILKDDQNLTDIEYTCVYEYSMKENGFFLCDDIAYIQIFEEVEKDEDEDEFRKVTFFMNDSDTDNVDCPDEKWVALEEYIYSNEKIDETKFGYNIREKIEDCTRRTKENRMITIADYGGDNYEYNVLLKESNRTVKVPRKIMDRWYQIRRRIEAFNDQDRSLKLKKDNVTDSEKEYLDKLKVENLENKDELLEYLAPQEDPIVLPIMENCIRCDPKKSKDNYWYFNYILDFYKNNYDYLVKILSDERESKGWFTKSYSESECPYESNLTGFFSENPDIFKEILPSYVSEPFTEVPDNFDPSDYLNLLEISNYLDATEFDQFLSIYVSYIFKNMEIDLMNSKVILLDEETENQIQDILRIEQQINEWLKDKKERTLRDKKAQSSEAVTTQKQVASR